MDNSPQNIVIIVVVIIIVVGIGSYFIFNRPIQAPSSLIQNPENITQAHNAFGFNSIKTLFSESLHQNVDYGVFFAKNVLISPFSLALALSTIYNGANGETKSAMRETLQFQNLDISTINQESLNLVNLLKNTNPDIELTVANSIWIKNGVDLKKDFLNTATNYFNTEISTLDFSNTNAVNTINTWVSKNTKKKVPTMADPIPRDTIMYLINAIYFKGGWTPGFEFDEKLTEDKIFATPLDYPTKLPFMRQDRELSYLETKDFQSVILPYGKNAHLGMYIFLAKNLSDFIQTLDENNWNKWMKQYKTTEGTLLLPKFKIASEESLVPLLMKLGMGIAFEDNADFTGLGNNLKISEVKHQTYIDVDEKGTEAGATTSVAQTPTTAPPSEKAFYMEVNHPFFFAIRDDQTQEILFMGIIENP